MSIGIIASSQFSPTYLSIDSWYSALNPNGDGSIPSDGAALSSVIDLGVKQNNMAQATVVNQPIYKRNIINGKNVFRCNGITFMSCAAGSGNNYSGPMTIFYVCATAVTTTINAAIGKGGEFGGCAGTSNTFRFTTSGIKDYQTSGSQFTNNVFLVESMRFNSDFSVDFWKNGTAGDHITGTTAMTSNNGTFTIFSPNTTPAFAWNGDIVMIGIFFRALAANEMLLMNTYCKNLIGV